MDQRKVRGFTLIEILIAIGILSILTSVLLATINPLEQISKSKDTALSSISNEFLNANTRYYTSHNAVPWQSAAEGGINCYTAGSTFTAIPLSSLANCLNSFVADGEIKQSFLNTANLNMLFVTSPNPHTGSFNEPIICYLPQSRAEQQSPNARYNQNGTHASNCKSQGGNGNCYTCHPQATATAVVPTSALPSAPTSPPAPPTSTPIPVVPTVPATPTTAPPASSNTNSLRFFGAQDNDIDRVKMPLTLNKSIDVANSFTLEWWMKTGTGNTGGTCTSGAAGVGDYDWITGNVLLSVTACLLRDIYTNNTHVQRIVSRIDLLYRRNYILVYSTRFSLRT